MTYIFKTRVVQALVLLALFAPALQPLPAQERTPIESIVAVVNEDVILRGELDQAIGNIVARIRAQGGNLPPDDILEKQVLENLVISRLEIQRAEQTGIRVSDADIDQALVQVARQNQLNVNQLRAAIEADGFDFSEFRRGIGDDIMSQRLRQRVISSMVNVSETEIDILLATEDLSGGEFDLSHIMIALPEGATPAQIEAAEERANEIHDKLDEGMDFTAAAISFSDAQDALNGGQLGWRDLNSIPKMLAEAIRLTPVGSYIEPVRSPAGFHIVRVNDMRESRQVVVRELNARHIMVATTELVTPEMAMERIMEIKGKLNAGEDFAELAKEYSDDTSSANLGGDMGWFPPEAYGTRIQQTLEPMQPNEISEPFQTTAGWHILQYLGARETDRTEEAIRNEAREKIRQRKADVELQQYLRQMRDEAYVDIRL